MLFLCDVLGKFLLLHGAIEVGRIDLRSLCCGNNWYQCSTCSDLM